MRQQKNIRKKVRIVVVYCDDTRQRISFAYTEKNHIAYKTLHTHIYMYVLATYLAYKLVAHINYAIKMPPRRLTHTTRAKGV